GDAGPASRHRPVETPAAHAGVGLRGLRPQSRRGAHLRPPAQTRSPRSQAHPYGPGSWLRPPAGLHRRGRGLTQEGAYMHGNQLFGRRATDLLDFEGRAWTPMPLRPNGVMSGADVRSHLTTIEELRQRVGELERHNRELAVFASDVAHDLRAPLQAVSGFAELLVRHESARLDETSQGFVAHILNAAGAMQELVEVILEHRQSSCGALASAWVDA